MSEKGFSPRGGGGTGFLKNENKPFFRLRIEKRGLLKLRNENFGFAEKMAFQTLRIEKLG